MSAYLKIFLIILITYTSAHALEEGSPSPDLNLPNTTGGSISINQLKGNIVYLDFWASWCAPCKKSLPWMNTLNQKFKHKKFKILAINLDSNKEDAEQMIVDQKLNFEILFDPQGLSPEMFNVVTMPSSYLIGPDMRIIKIFRGFDDAHKELIEQKIEEAIKEIN